MALKQVDLPPFFVSHTNTLLLLRLILSLLRPAWPCFMVNRI